MTRTITTAAELDALPVKVVLLDEGGWPVWRDPHTGWCASNGTRGIPADLLIADGAPLTVLHDPSAPAPAPSAATARHERAVAYADDVAEGGAPVPDDYERHYCTEDGEDWPCGAARAAPQTPTDRRSTTVNTETDQAAARVSEAQVHQIADALWDDMIGASRSTVRNVLRDLFVAAGIEVAS